MLSLDVANMSLRYTNTVMSIENLKLQGTDDI